MNRVFYILLFLTISGFGVLWWLFNSLPPDEEMMAPVEKHGLVIHEEKKEAGEAHPETHNNAHGESHEKSHAEAEGAEHKVEHSHEPKAEHKEEVPAHSEHSTSGEESTKEAAAAGSGDHASEPSESLSKNVHAEKSSLFIESQPSGAVVYMDGVLKGKTPFTFDLAAADKILRIELDGYQRQERSIEERHRESGALTRWKIELVAQTPIAKEAAFQKADYRLTGTRGPVFVQLKAVDSKDNTGWLLAVQSFREKLKNKNVYICDVDLGAKGRWTRFLMGPYGEKSEAQSNLKAAKDQGGEAQAFVVGEQKCLE